MSPDLSIRQISRSVKQFKVDPTGSYLITGGFGGLGLKVAEWLVKHGAKHLGFGRQKDMPKKSRFPMQQLKQLPSISPKGPLLKP